jgi:hypothetical protein
MSPGDPIVYHSPNGDVLAIYVARYGLRNVIEIPAWGSRGTGLIYVRDDEIAPRPPATSTPEHPNG